MTPPFVALLLAHSPRRAGAPSLSPDILLTQNPMILLDFLRRNRKNRYKRLTHCLPLKDPRVALGIKRRPGQGVGRREGAGRGRTEILEHEKTKTEDPPDTQRGCRIADGQSGDGAPVGIEGLAAIFDDTRRAPPLLVEQRG